uniref:Uncharacterized protein n=1 Tax=Pyramimonas orientalis virus TaxID=455367 RepID=A0A7M3UP37_POV01|nr:hypothetical protein HWQ62_00361 [Pyramimonas orientalis virus]
MPSSTTEISHIYDIFESQLDEEEYYIHDGNIIVYCPDGDELIVNKTD